LNPAEPNKETVAAKRIAPLPGKKDEYNVELAISKDLRQHAARVFDQVPAGYTAGLLEGHGAKFSVVNGMVEFYWETLPKDSVFTVSYHLVRSGNGTITEEVPEANGEMETHTALSPFHDDTLTMSPQPAYSDLPNLSKPQPQHSLHTEVPSLRKTLAKQPVHAGTPAPQKTQTRQQVIADVSAPQKTPKKQFTYVSVPAQLTQLVYAWIPVPYHGQLLVCINRPAPAPGKGIYYKVQIAAIKGASDRKADLFISQYHISESMDTMMHEGWKKYLVGTFTKFAEADRYKVETQAKIPDAFVVAFNNDERIPLHEALKSQKRTHKI
jgi:hypothetical protein